MSACFYLCALSVFACKLAQRQPKFDCRRVGLQRVSSGFGLIYDALQLALIDLQQ